MSLARVAVLASGRGSNFLALDDAMRRGDVAAQVVLVLSDRPAAAALEHARARGIEAQAIGSAACRDRAEHDAAVVAALEGVDADWVCLAGYMRLLGPMVVAAFAGRILNVHPSLLPAFPGLAAQRQALLHGVRFSGCTVHFVDEGLDSGPIVGQAVVPVEADDDEASLSGRILAEEHRLYPHCLQRLLTEPWALDGRRVCFGSSVVA